MDQTIDDQVRELHETDQRLCFVLDKLSLVQVELLSQTSSFGPWYKDCVFTAGSQKEGGLYARMFQHGKHIHEADFMFSIGRITDPMTQLESIKNAPGFFSVKSEGIVECFHDGVLEKFLRIERCGAERVRQGDYLDRSFVLKMTSEMFTSTPAKTRGCEYAADMIFQPRIPCKATLTFKQKGPSAVTGILFESAGEHVSEVWVDTVPCFALSSWPDDWGFREFVNRNRKWPSPEIVGRVQSMVHLVPKASPGLKTEREREKCWRLSFSQAELFLRSLFSLEENHVYLLFKILFYDNMKKIEVDGKTMASYFCKTTMLWTMEEEGEEFSKGDLLQAVRTLFEKFKYFLDSNSGLPNFFYPRTNLLEGYPKELVSQCSKMAENIIQQPLCFLPLNFQEVCAHLTKTAKRLDELELEQFADSVSTPNGARADTRGITLTELYWRSREYPNWRVRLLFHPVVRAMVWIWVRRRFFAYARCCYP